jgi:hypothetical protein
MVAEPLATIIEHAPVRHPPAPLASRAAEPWFSSLAGFAPEDSSGVFFVRGMRAPGATCTSAALRHALDNPPRQNADAGVDCH